MDKAEEKHITKFCYQGCYYHLEYSITLYNSHICWPHGNVWEDSLEILGLNLFRVSPKYSSIGVLASLLARREAKSAFVLQAQTPARHFFFNKTKSRSFHSARPPMLATQARVCCHSASQGLGSGQNLRCVCDLTQKLSEGNSYSTAATS